LSVVLNIIGTTPLRGIGEHDIRAEIVYNDRFFGYLRGVWPNAENIEALSRRILYPEGIKVIERTFCGKLEERDHILEVIHHDSSIPP
jgi:hypothetical protein